MVSNHEIHTHCVVCGERIDNNHHCKPARENKIEGARRSHTELGRQQPRQLGERLRDGFRMLNE